MCQLIELKKYQTLAFERNGKNLIGYWVSSMLSWIIGIITSLRSIISRDLRFLLHIGLKWMIEGSENHEIFMKSASTWFHFSGHEDLQIEDKWWARIKYIFSISRIHILNLKDSNLNGRIILFQMMVNSTEVETNVKHENLHR